MIYMPQVDKSSSVIHLNLRANRSLGRLFCALRRTCSMTLNRFSVCNRIYVEQGFRLIRNRFPPLAIHHSRSLNIQCPFQDGVIPWEPKSIE